MKKKSFWLEDWELVYHSSKFCVFSDFSKDPKSFDKSLDNLYIPCLLLIITLCSKISKSQTIMKMIVTSIVVSSITYFSILTGFELTFS